MGADVKFFLAASKLLKNPGTAPETTRTPVRRPGFSLCARGDLNPHARRHRNLNPACLPISPLARGAVVVPGKNPGAGARLYCTYPVCERLGGTDGDRGLGVEFQVPAKFGDMPGGPDVVLRDGNLAVGVDNDGGADQALVVLP